ncbi:putative plastid-lipid-associated protein 11 [Cinnamomum micranthum f. kanehirae]|uniref:Putative plastid-lipid-associated protein 11 n=1 Tax=Cinnamomum micranthum f. kanehirae TaxID=337451 RepID=A0A3S3N8R0_9MAGN|nr:putative plastid-lipid-associated protein 11 [Cinnamomum micranthum f. kanehirae]
MSMSMSAVPVLSPASSTLSFTQTLQNPKPHHVHPKTLTPSSIRSSSSPSLVAKDELLSLISDQERGLKTEGNPSKRSKIIEAIEALSIVGKDTITTDSLLSATWRMMWTTEKEQLFIIKNAPLFGTQAGDVLQVIDVEGGTLNNVITFPPSGVFFVRSSIEIASTQRVNFRFSSAVLRGKNWEFPLPPFGQGWFESIYLDDEIRVVKDIRGDYLVVDRAPYNWTE